MVNEVGYCWSLLELSFVQVNDLMEMYCISALVDIGCDRFYLYVVYVSQKLVIFLLQIIEYISIYSNICPFISLK